jgi:hypothetical protein
MPNRDFPHSLLLLLLLGALAAALAPTGAPAAETAPATEFARRADAFAFAEKPKVTRDGDTTTITFATTADCDATVAIEDASGTVVRHLASGVLGANAPKPFQKGTRRQTLIWNGKNDQGRYVDDIDAHTVRVSLGLRARLAKTLFWSPHRRTRAPRYMGNYLVVRPTKEGIYAYDGGNCLHVRLFDHDGKYVRTVYPPPAGKLDAFNGLKWHTFPQDGKKLPLKWGLPQYTFLTSGTLGWDGKRWPTGGTTDAATVIAAHGDRIALINKRLNRLAPDGGTSPGADGTRLPLAGPQTCIVMYVRGVHSLRSGDYEIPPQSAAFSPDGRTLYLTGFRYHKSWRVGCTHAVYKLDYESDEPMTLFKGSPYKDSRHPGGPGKDNEHFNWPASVDCDAKGRVYVADFLNDRVQIFAPDGTYLKTIPVSKPAQVSINRKTGEIYVFSYVLFTAHFWYQKNELKSIKRSLKRFQSFDEPRQTGGWALPRGTYGFPRGGGGLNEAYIELDFHTDPPRAWVQKSQGPVLYEIQERQWKQVFHFVSEAKKPTSWPRGARHMKQRIYFDPMTETLFVGDLHSPWPFHVTGFHTIPAVDTRTGRCRVVGLPFDTEDMAIDHAGRAYLRTADGIARFDAKSWREIPFDYGDHVRKMSAQGLKHSNVHSAITYAGVLGVASGQLGGMSVSPVGDVAVTVANPAKPPSRDGAKNMHASATVRYTPPIFPGRARPWEVHVWDRHGKPLYPDAVPGTGRMDGVLIDRDHNLYVVIAGVGRVKGKKYFNPMSCSIFKVRPGTKIVGTRGALPLPKGLRPNRPPDVYKVDGAGDIWIDGAEWVRGGIGFDGKRLKCHCMSQSRPALDGYARLFLPEIDRYSVLVTDTNGNEILRIGRYGNVDDGKPLDPRGGPEKPRSIGGDEVALMHAQMLAVHSDRDLYASDLGNQRIVKVKLDYEASERVALKNAGK